MASSNDHYDAVANFYESAWFYKSDSDFHKWYVARVAERLAVRPGEKVIDFGGGDGVFTQSLHNTHAGLPATTMCVDPSPGMLEKAKAKPGLDVLLGDDMTFITSTTLRYDKMLIKEVIHHLADENVPKFFEAARSQVPLETGAILTVTRLPTAEHYPFFPLAWKVWMANSGTPYLEYAQIMRDAGFSVSTEVLDYEVVIGKEQWFTMIRNRFWSTFADMSDGEIEEGLAHLEGKLAEGAFGYNSSDGNLHFSDRLVFILAGAAATSPAKKSHDQQPVRPGRHR